MSEAPPKGARAQPRDTSGVSVFDDRPSGAPTNRYAVLDAATMAPPALEETPIVVVATPDPRVIETFERELPGAAIVRAVDFDDAFAYGALVALRAIVLDLRAHREPVWLPDDFTSRALFVVWGGDESSLVGDHVGEKLPCDGGTDGADVAQLTCACLGLSRPTR